jgi:hypothetical protein
VQTASAWSTHPDAVVASAEAYQSLCERLNGHPQLLFAHCTATHDVDALRKVLGEMAPGVPIHGGTSCIGVMTEEGFHSQQGCGLGLFGLRDEAGRYGVGCAPLGSSPGLAAQQALEQALGAIDKRGMAPALVVITTTPGAEEQVIAGLEAYLGPNVPIAGGSAADNNVAGGWKLFTRAQVFDAAVVVTALFPSSEVVFSFHSGYEPTPYKGIVTRASGRSVYEIDGRPAVAAYDEWTKGALSQWLSAPGNVLAHTTLYPLGREVGSVGGMANYQLSHPDTVLPGGGLTVFTEIAVGDEVVLMHGTHEGLVARAGRVAQAALKTHDRSVEQVAGALVIYCAGCMLTVQSRMQDVAGGLRNAIGDQPSLTTFTFGEQGCFVGGENRHGNLMISVLLFMKD